MDKPSNENHSFPSYYSHITAFQYFCFAAFFWLNSCAPPSPQPENQVIVDPVTKTSVDLSQITFVLPIEISAQQLQFIDETLKEMSAKSMKHILADSIQDDSLFVLIEQTIFNDFSSIIPAYEFISTTSSGDSLLLKYRLNKTYLNHIIKPYLDTYGHPAQKSIAPLFALHHNPPVIDSFSGLTLIPPCENVAVPTRALLLPNAPRSYRNGIHRGIDFYVNWGTPVRAVSDGTVIRADHHFEEVPPEFRKRLLAEAKRLGHTPSDVFEHILVGQSIYIDHGFDLVSGYRALSIYAHLSNIDPEIKPGAIVSAGQIIGRSGNSGTKDSTLGTRKGAHLHWELILQDEGGEYYLGQGLAAQELLNVLLHIFRE